MEDKMEEYFYVEKTKLEKFQEWKCKTKTQNINFEENLPGIIGGGFGLFIFTKDGIKNSHIRKYKNSEIFDLGEVQTCNLLNTLDKEKYAVIFCLNEKENEKKLKFLENKNNGVGYCFHTKSSIKTIHTEKSWSILSNNDASKNDIAWIY